MKERLERQFLSRETWNSTKIKFRFGYMVDGVRQKMRGFRKVQSSADAFR